MRFTRVIISSSDIWSGGGGSFHASSVCTEPTISGTSEEKAGASGVHWSRGSVPPSTTGPLPRPWMRGSAK